MAIWRDLWRLWWSLFFPKLSLMTFISKGKSDGTKSDMPEKNRGNFIKGFLNYCQK